jgi:hypothetical protein
MVGQLFTFLPWLRETPSEAREFSGFKTSVEAEPENTSTLIFSPPSLSISLSMFSLFHT